MKPRQREKHRASENNNAAKEIKRRPVFTILHVIAIVVVGVAILNNTKYHDENQLPQLKIL